MADAIARPPRARGHDLGPGRAVLHRALILVGLAEHGPVGGDERNEDLRVARDALRQRVEHVRVVRPEPVPREIGAALGKHDGGDGTAERPICPTAWA